MRRPTGDGGTTEVHWQGRLGGSLPAIRSDLHPRVRRRRPAPSSMRVYDCRHAAATTWRRAGVPLGEVAKLMGHSVETLVSTYVGALASNEMLANERIDLALATP